MKIQEGVGEYMVKTVISTTITQTHSSDLKSILHFFQDCLVLKGDTIAMYLSMNITSITDVEPKDENDARAAIE